MSPQFHHCAGNLLQRNSCRMQYRRTAIALGLVLVVSQGEAQQATLPYPTGTHRLLVRTFHTQQQDLPSEEIRAVAVTREGAVFVASANSLVRLQPDDARNGERWIPVSGPSNVTSLFTAPRETDALAGAADGVWALAQGQWQKEAGSPASVIAFAAEPAGHAWALAPSGVWRRTDGWTRIHV